MSRKLVQVAPKCTPRLHEGRLSIKCAKTIEKEYCFAFLVLRQVGTKLAEVGPNLVQVGLKLVQVRSKLAQVGANLAQVGAKLASS